MHWTRERPIGDILYYILEVGVGIHKNASLPTHLTMTIPIRPNVIGIISFPVLFHTHCEPLRCCALLDIFL